MFSTDDLQRLMNTSASPAVSVFLPTHIAGRDIRQDPIRLRRHLDQARETLMDRGLRRPEAEALLAPGRALEDDPRFWRHQNRGLAVFLAKDLFQFHRLPMAFDEQVTVGRRFHINPLLPLLAADGTFFLLTASWARAALYQGSRFGLSEVEANLPQGVGEVARESDYQNTRHSSPVARPRLTTAPGGIPKTFNFGEDPEQLRETESTEYLRRLAHAVQDRLNGTQAPVVLAAREEIQGHFRSLSRLRALLGRGIDLNPDAVEVNLDRLRAEAYDLVHPLFDADRAKTVDYFRSLFGDGSPRAPTKAEDIVNASREGRVDSLLLIEGAEIWGWLDETSGRVMVNQGPDNQREDLLGLATVETLTHGGTVHLVAKDALPPGAQAAAVLRF